MTTADAHAQTPDSPAAAGAAGAAPDATTPLPESHDEHAVHTYESGLSEGNARVPIWLATVFVSLVAFFVWYVITYASAQPNTARAKESSPASAPASPEKPAPGNAGGG